MWHTTDRGPLDRRRGRIFVAVATGFVTVLGSHLAGFGQPEARPFDLVALALLLVTPLAIVFLLPRRPAAAVVGSVAATGTFLLAGYPWGPALAGPVILLAATTLAGPWRRGRAVAWAGGALLLGMIMTAGTLTPPQWSPPSWDGRHGPPWMDTERRGDQDLGGTSSPVTGLSPGGVAAGTAWTVVALLAAGAVRDRTGRRLAARDAARRSAAERERTAVTAERLRIARELHDVLAHSLSGINVQAGVGLHLLDRDLDQARTALSSIRDTSRDALAEVRTLLGIVRVPFDVTWDLSGLERLAAQSGAEGLDVSLDVDAPELPDRVAGAVHRVVQESLTNVRRHAVGATRVRVSVRRDRGTCTVTVSDDGRDARSTASDTREESGGYGLRGMRERVEALDGTLWAGPDDVGWLVHATFPLSEASP